MSQEPFQRVQVDFSKRHIAGLKLMMEQLGLSKWKELFDVSLTLLQWAVNERRKGRVIGSIDEQDGSYSELQLPPLNFIQQTKIEPNKPHD